MKITINGQAVNEAEVSGQSLEEVLIDIMSRHMPEDHLARRVLVNGERYVEEVPHDAAQVPRTDIDRLEVITISRQEIASEFMTHGPAILGTMIEAAPKVAELFRVADESEANEHYLTFLQTLQEFLMMINLTTKALGIDPETPFVQGRTLAQEGEELNRIVNEMLGVQEERDWVLLADLIEYDLFEVLQRWQEGMPSLQGGE